jgi:hypothetical protein
MSPPVFCPGRVETSEGASASTEESLSCSRRQATVASLVGVGLPAIPEGLLEVIPTISSVWPPSSSLGRSSRFAASWCSLALASLGECPVGDELNEHVTEGEQTIVGLIDEMLGDERLQMARRRLPGPCRNELKQVLHREAHPEHRSSSDQIPLRWPQPIESGEEETLDRGRDRHVFVVASAATNCSTTSGLPPATSMTHPTLWYETLLLAR